MSNGGAFSSGSLNFADRHEPRGLAESFERPTNHLLSERVGTGPGSMVKGGSSEREKRGNAFKRVPGGAPKGPHKTVGRNFRRKRFVLSRPFFELGGLLGVDSSRHI